MAVILTFQCDIFTNLIVEVRFHVSSIRHYVVVVNMSDVRSRKMENELKRFRRCWPFGFPIWEFTLKKSSCVTISWNSCNYDLSYLNQKQNNDLFIFHGNKIEDLFHHHSPHQCYQGHQRVRWQPEYKVWNQKYREYHGQQSFML
jgi:hypothetical protein